MDPETLKILGLAPDAAEDEIREKVAANAASAAKAGELEEKLSITGESMRTLQAEREQEQADERTKKIAELRTSALAKGLWEPGSPREKHFERACAVDLAFATSFVATLSPQNPVGGAQQSAGGDVDQGQSDPMATALSSEYTIPDGMMGVYKKALAQCRVDAGTLEKFGPEAIRKKEELHIDDWTASMRGEA